jgi:transglutaminase-like putative cysteine protease
MLLRIDHETRMIYSAPVSETVIELHMAPQSSEDQTVLGYRLRTTPSTPVTSYRDSFGNRAELLNVLGAHQEVLLRTTSYVRTHRRCGQERLAAAPWPAPQPPSLEALEFLTPSPLVAPGPEIDAVAEPLRGSRGTLASLLDGILARVRGLLRYEKDITGARTPVREALRLGRGVCQDFAHLMIGVCRNLGLPARYASGYVNHPGEIATHAWCQVWAGAAGWVDVDPTRGKVVEDDHVVTAVGRDYHDVPPNRGVWKGKGTETLTVTVKVEPVERMPLDGADVAGAPLWASAAPSTSQRFLHVQGAGYRNNVRLLYRHQQQQQQQGG